MGRFREKLSRFLEGNSKVIVSLGMLRRITRVPHSACLVEFLKEHKIEVFHSPEDLKFYVDYEKFIEEVFKEVEAYKKSKGK